MTERTAPCGLGVFPPAQVNRFEGGRGSLSTLGEHSGKTKHRCAAVKCHQNS